MTLTTTKKPVLWTAPELVAATAGRVSGAWSVPVTGISIDTRTLQHGDLYIALVGDAHDGHKFAARALELGAAGVLLSHAVEGLAADAPVLMVENCDKALWDLAACARARSTARIAAVTGSSGKSTTREMLGYMAEAQAPHAVHMTEGNLNNHIGLPLMLARLPQHAKYGIFELGMDHAGEISRLTHLLKPHVALITTIGVVHIEFFPEGQVGIAKAKAEIFEGLEPTGTAIIPAEAHAEDLLRAAALAHGAAVCHTFGDAAGATAVVHDVVVQPDATSRVEMTLDGRDLAFSLSFMGRHNARNAAGALLAAQALGLDVEKAAVTLGALEPLKGRGARKTLGKVLVLDECYNANPQSMTAAISNLGACPLPAGGRRIAVLGDMLELGAEGPADHAALAAVLQAAQVDQVFCCGALMTHLWAALPDAMKGAHAPTAHDLTPLVAAAVESGDVVLVKGSRGKQVMLDGHMCPSMAEVIDGIAKAVGAGARPSSTSQKGGSHAA